ncbi:ATP-binding cassette sub-family A member 2-like [Lingula anatina]|uniref:ATP-binding cassette sub-family A member 2 n=1 Tax=Lingula anatina TaxID=7574 RepID=A0A1S3H652_LINAN|nr:ATP-binding cassette sub-family A member 2-like [Lingula anatina]|eukprot:XP_013381483.2 ATP-binding cassette sub-family A member 2-like [Lingula anatina]
MTGFFHQLRLLLWKNLTLKKRSPFVLLFELCIPLVLFFILLGIRKKQPAHQAGASFFHARPLPSAGTASILQAFCDTPSRDEHGFPEFPKSSIKDFLRRFSNIAEHNNFFQPGFTPEEMSEIPSIYRSIIEDPVALHKQFQQAQNLKLSSIFLNTTSLHVFLRRNLSIPEEDVDTLLNSELNLKEMFQLLFAGDDSAADPVPHQNRSREVRSVADNEIDDTWSPGTSRVPPISEQETANTFLQDKISDIAQQMAGNKLPNVNWREHLSQIAKNLQNAPKMPENSGSQFSEMNPQKMMEGVSGIKPMSLVMKNIADLLNSTQIQDGREQPEGLVYRILEGSLLNDSKVVDTISHVLGFGGLDNNTVTSVQVIKALEVVVLSPEALQTAACRSQEMLAVLHPMKNETSHNMTHALKALCNMTQHQWKSLSQELQRMVDAKKLSKMLKMSEMNITAAEKRVKKLDVYVKKYTWFQKNLLELSQFASAMPQDSCRGNIDRYGNIITTTTTTTTTTTPSSFQEAVHMAEPPEKTMTKVKDNKFAGLMKIWSGLQKTICGKPFKLTDEQVQQFAEDRDFKSLGLSKEQEFEIGILVHVLYSNPKVLFAPNNSAAVQNIMKKANETFALFDEITQYAKQWLKVSYDLRDYLNQSSTRQNLLSLQEMQSTIRNQYSILPRLNIKHPGINTFIYNLTIPTVDEFLHELDGIDSAACSWITLVNGISFNIFEGFRTEKELVDYVLHKAFSQNKTVLASVVFTNMRPDGTLPPHVVYKIRQNASFTETTKAVRPRYWSPGNRRNGFKYYFFGFVWIQDVVERAIINLQTGRDIIEPGSYIHQFPQPCFMYDQFILMIEHVMPLCLTISWVYSVAMLVQGIVYEKEQRLKEVMKMMGLNNAVHWLAWFITSFGQMTVTMGMVTIILKYGNILTYSDPLLVFLVLECFALATISFSFFLSVLYSKAKLAAACAGIIYFLTYVPYMYIAIREEAAGDKVSAVTKSIASLMSTTAFGLGAKYFAFYEEEGVGVQWSNMNISPVEEDQYNLYYVTVMMLVDTLIYGILVWYIENVHPGSYGLPKPWYFPLTKSYWCGHAIYTEHKPCGLRSLWSWWRDRSNQFDMSVMEEDQACAMEQRPQDDSQCFERDPSHLPLGVHIDNLVKVYKNGKLAVNKLSLDLFEGQITSFLGHNGAGKTTTMSILTGLFPPTAGYAQIYGLDIRTDMEDIRKSLGMCPQHNVLFDKMTVEEHLWFYSKLKGMDAKSMKAEMDQMIYDLGLPKKRHSPVDCLSGGMKRKLSVAIAFIAGSRTVILDEPTSGVDPYARRQIWDLLIKYKKDRTVLLSTHYMDEADLLGDRIAIISSGQLKCCGSSLFLKSTFGDGYHLKMVKKPSEVDAHSINDEPDTFHPSSSFITHCVEDTVTEFVKKYVSTAYITKATNHELHYILPFEEAKKGNFEKLFHALDSHLDQLDISSYGVMDTSLEEVFLTVTEKPKKNPELDEEEVKNLENQTIQFPLDDTYGMTNQASDGDEAMIDLEPVLSSGGDVELGDLGTTSAHRRQWSDGSIHHVSLHTGPHAQYARLVNEDTQSIASSDHEPQPHPGAGSYIVSGGMLRFQQLLAVIVKRFYYIRRNWKGLFSQILLPALFVAIAMTVALSAPKLRNLPPLTLSPAQYYNYTQPRGNYVPYNNQAKDSPNAVGKQTKTQQMADSIIQTFMLPSGLGATCILKRPINNAFDADLTRTLTGNYSQKTFKLLAEYFEPGCESVFVKGLPLSYFVPPPPTAPPVDEDTLNLLDNDTESSSTTHSPDGPHFYPHCICAKDGSGFVCPLTGFLNPEEKKLVTSDILVDITSQDTSQYLLHTTNAFRLHRYGAVSVGLERDYVPDRFGEHAPPLFRQIAVKRVSKVWYNQKGYHSMPTYLNTLNNAILRANLPKKKGNPAAYGITVVNHPMSNTNDQLNIESILKGSDVLIAIFIICAMSFVPASFVLFLVYERSTKSKHLQFVSGIDPVIYWLANYIWDMCNYLIPMSCCIIILRVFDIPSYVSDTNFPAVVSLFLLYGWSITPLMYPASFVFKEPSTAYIFLIVINLFVGITCIITSFLLDMFDYDKDLHEVHKVLSVVFLLFPNYCLGRGLMDIAFNEYHNEYYYRTGQYGKVMSPFDWDLVPRNLAAMGSMGFVFFIITLLCEYRFFIKSKRLKVESSVITDDDEDVAAERKRVLRGSGRNDMLRLENLTKIYKTRKLGRHLAVDRLCLGVPQGECFGLLGVNGAGKTTTFKMLTGDIQPTGGDAFLNGYSIHADMLKVQQNIGYCPQFDALYDQLTAREHLQLYARLRGVPYKDEKMVVQWALEKFDLLSLADNLSGSYSGGNKRKLSTAIALLGNPPVIFLDEPTTGMDPQSRRFLWDIILNLIKDGRSVILTSHSMEECEELCTRLAIMVNGHFKCIGSIQHLKNKFGKGYTVTVRVKGHDIDREVRAVRRYMNRHFPDAELKEQHHNTVQYELASSTLSLGTAFAKMEEAQRDLNVEEYSICQNTLDNVFISFVKMQSELVRERHDTGETDLPSERSQTLHRAEDDDDEPLLDAGDDMPLVGQSGSRLAFMSMEVMDC